MIISGNQIKINGVAPQAAAVGIDVAGTVVSMKHHEWSDLTSSSATTWADVAGSSFVFTPKFATSKLLIHVAPQINSNTNAGGSNTGCSFILVANGTTVGSTPTGHENYLNSFGATTMDMYTRPIKVYTHVPGSAAEITFKLQLISYNTVGFNKINQNNGFRSSVTVWEIAQ